MCIFVINGECDFVTFDKNEIQDAVQVCYNLTQDNLQRELNGLVEAMKFFNLSKGTIVTYNQTDHFEVNDRIVQVVPAFKWLMD